MKNSHYVPKFILKRFSDKLCLYNIKTGEFVKNVKLDKAYCKKGFYDDNTEEKLNLRLESQFARLLNEKILKCKDKIELSREELLLIKKFLLISVIRSINCEELMQKEKNFYDELIIKLKKQGSISKKEDETRIRPFIEEKISNETSFEYWMRTINVILNTNGSPEEILKHPKKTYPAFRWAMVINAGYLAFWDSEYNRDEFVITDIGMTSENEKGWNGVTVHNIKKTNFLLKLLQIEKNEIMKDIIINQIQFLTSFHENFQMFPISARRMIVLISPFYKFREMYKNRYLMPNLETLTELVNEELFSPNDVFYVHNQVDIKPKYHPDDKYIYKIKQLTRKETRYCNALFLDRIDTTLGFSSLDKIVGSVLFYKRLNKYYVPRVNYICLYKIINERYQGSLLLTGQN